MSIVNCPHCGNPVQINIRAKVPTWDQKPSTKATRTLALTTLMRYGVELASTPALTDEQLLSLPNFGRKALAFVRAEAGDYRAGYGK